MKRNQQLGKQSRPGPGNWSVGVLGRKLGEGQGWPGPGHWAKKWACKWAIHGWN